VKLYFQTCLKHFRDALIFRYILYDVYVLIAMFYQIYIIQNKLDNCLAFIQNYAKVQFGVSDTFPTLVFTSKLLEQSVSEEACIFSQKCVRL
jgi:hypothetical protein